MKKRTLLAVTVLAVFFGFLSCKKDLSCEGCAERNNQPPTASTGPDQVITLPTDSVLLDGSASTDPDGSIASYKWSKLSGPSSFSIAKPHSAKTTVHILTAGVYQFELTVTDNSGLTGKDTLQVLVDNPLVNQPPVAHAGQDTTLMLPTDVVILDGRKSVDLENNITAYQWTKISGPSASITSATTVQTKVTGLVEGTYRFELQVSDAGRLSDKDTVQVKVTAPQQNPSWPVVHGTFTEIGKLSEPRYPAAASAGSKVVFAGGMIYRQCGAFCTGEVDMGTATVDIYDMASQAWSKAQLSKARVGMAVITNGNKIFFAGGHHWECNQTGWSMHVSYDNVDIYDAANNTWTVAHLSNRRTILAAAAVGNKVLFAGGYFFTGNPASQHVWDVSNKVDIYDLSTNQWSTATLSASGHELASTRATTVGNKVYFITGNHVDVYDNTTNTWATTTLQAVSASLSPPAEMATVKDFATIGNHLIFYNDDQVGVRNLATGRTSVVSLINRSAPFLVDNSIVFFTSDIYFVVYNTTTGVWYNGITITTSTGGAVPRVIAGAPNMTYMGGGYITYDCATFTDKVFKLTW